MVFSRRAFITTAVVGAASLGLENEDRKKPDSSKADAVAVAAESDSDPELRLA